MKLFLLVLSAILMSMPLGSRELFFFSWLGFIPALKIIIDMEGMKNTFIWGWFWGFLLALGAGYWLVHPIEEFSGLPLPLVIVLTALLLLTAAIFTAVWSVIFKLLSSDNKFSVLVFAFSWTGVEFIRGMIFPYYPFGFLGLTQSGFDPFLQLAEVGGIYLLSFMAAAVSGLLFKFIRSKNPGFLIILAAVLVISTAAAYHFSGRAEQNWAENERRLKTGIVMTEIPQEDKWEDENIETNLESVAEDTEEVLNQGAEIAVTPETSLTFDFVRNEYYREKFLGLIEEPGYMMVGSQIRDAELGGNFNSYLLLDEEETIKNRYNKNDLIPGEIIPFAGLAEILTGREWHSLNPGVDKNIMNIEAQQDEFEFRVLTCSEILYSPPDRDQLTEIDFIINPSNEAWFGDTNLLNQMWESARIRAVEMRTPVIKSGNKAIGGYINPRGEEVIVEDREVLSAGAGRAHSSSTFYQEHGDFIGYISLLMVLIFIPGFRLLQTDY